MATICSTCGEEAGVSTGAHAPSCPGPLDPCNGCAVGKSGDCPGPCDLSSNFVAYCRQYKANLGRLKGEDIP